MDGTLLKSKTNMINQKQPQLIYNDYHQGMKLGYELIKEFQQCDYFELSIAFISKSGLAVLKQTLLDLSERNIRGKIVTSTYLNFNEPATFKELLNFKNIEVRIYQDDKIGFHPKGYLFYHDRGINIIIGSANLTQNALAINQEWNLKISSNKDDDIINKIKQEFNYQWSHAVKLNEQWIEEYQKQYQPPAINKPLKQKKDIKPNHMQKNALDSLRKMRQDGKNKALIISATGTGKTYLSAFDVLNFNPKRMLFVVHRENIALAALKSFQKIITNHQLGMFTGNLKDIEADYLFATIQTIHKDEYLRLFKPDTFDYIIIDEVHRAGASSYQQLINYFKPQFLLGMSATPQRNDDIDIYKLFDYNIACEIRLQQAMENDYLCPFHYYGIRDITVDGKSLDDKSDFNYLIGEQRVDHIIQQIERYGYSGNRVRGLIFVSRKQEAKELSIQFNQKGYRTIALTGEDSETKRKIAMEKLESDHQDDYLDYIFTVDIFNEGIDIPKINQIVMLRPTQSAIIFVQQLGRGLRKHNSKDYVVVIDFIANYQKNFLIPIALSGNLSYNKDNLRRFVAESSLVIPGVSTVSFDRISKKKIYESIDTANFNDVKIIKEAYFNLKQKLGRIPNLKDFDLYESIDVLRIFQNKNLGSYHKFLSKYEKEYHHTFNKIQEQYLTYIATKFASGKRIHELEAIKLTIEKHSNLFTHLKKRLKNEYQIELQTINYDTIINLLTQNFATGSAKKTFEAAVFIDDNLNIAPTFKQQLQDKEFKKQVLELIDFGIHRYNLNYANRYQDTDFCLYEKYTYEDVCRLLNWEKNLVPLNIGGYKYDQHTNTFPVFINYDKDDNISETIKYEDKLVDQKTLICFSKANRNLESNEVIRIYNHQENQMQIHLFIRKNKEDAISKEFYYLGKMHPIGKPKQMIMVNTTNNVVRFTYQLENPIRKDIFDYITNND